ncbi:MAG: sialate O-acetylesterase, partial [Bacteroidales bacterium]|nr:sialate O-acetylesterase [Bacteroidales bacterium]
HFAAKLQKDLNVPVGIILCYKGGTPVESWMSEETLKKCGEYDSVWDFFNKRVPDNYQNAYEKYLAYSKEYKEANVETQQTLEKPVEPYGWRNYKRPTGLYELMLKPLIPYTVKGFIWYQGEGNAARAKQYQTLFPALIEEWREEFSAPKAPFIFAQLPIYEHPNFKYAAWAELRESQLLTSQTVENTAMAVILDAGDKNDLHPTDKFPVGQRMALAAENIAYKKNVVSRSPETLHIMENGNRIILSFSIFGSEGLALSGNCAELNGFEIVLEDDSVVAAKAVLLDENKIEIYCNDINQVKQIRYGWANFFEPCLANKEGLYASPFRMNIE